MTTVTLASTARQRGGVWRHVIDLAEGLRAAGTDVLIALPADAADLHGAALERGLPSATVDQALRRDADIWHVHLHDTLEREATTLMLLRRLRRPGRPIAVTEHLPRTDATDPRLLPGPRTRGATTAKRAVKALHATVTDVTIALSHGSAAFLRERWGWDARVRLVANGVAADPDPVDLPADRPLRVVVPGAVIMQKGHDVLLQAAALAREPWSATVVGEGPHREQFTAAARERGLSERVTFAGWVDDVPALVASSHVVGLPSRWESCPYAALEAMAAGRAVVGTAVDGLTDLVVDGASGRLVAPEDPRALAEALDELARDRRAVAAMGAAAHRRVRASFTKDMMISATASVYEEWMR
jgi:glycosyltransferase involved in cell wall biosynthesis